MSALDHANENLDKSVLRSSIDWKEKGDKDTWISGDERTGVALRANATLGHDTNRDHLLYTLIGEPPAPSYAPSPRPPMAGSEPSSPLS